MNTEWRVPLWVRAWHWATALLFVLLTLSGALLHFAVRGLTPLDYAVAVRLHDTAGLALTGVYLLFVATAFATGYWRNYVPRGRGLWQRVRSQFMAYLRGRAPAGQGEAAAVRFNPLQQLAYLAVLFLLLPLLIVTGLLYLYPPQSGNRLDTEALVPLALAHYAVGVLGAVYLIVHVYLATLGGMRAMLEGVPRSASRTARE